MYLLLRQFSRLVANYMESQVHKFFHKDRAHVKLGASYKCSTLFHRRTMPTPRGRLPQNSQCRPGHREGQTIPNGFATQITPTRLPSPIMALTFSYNREHATKRAPLQKHLYLKVTLTPNVRGVRLLKRLFWNVVGPTNVQSSLSSIFSAYKDTDQFSVTYPTLAFKLVYEGII